MLGKINLPNTQYIPNKMKEGLQATQVFSFDYLGKIIEVTGPGTRPQYVLTSQLQAGEDVENHVIRIYAIGQEKVHQSSVTIHKTSKEWNSFKRENYLLHADQSGVHIYVRNEDELYKLKYTPNSSRLTTEKIINCGFGDDFQMTVNPLNGELIFYSRQQIGDKKVGRFSFGDKELSLAGTEFDTPQWLISALKAIDFEGQLRLFAIFMHIGRDHSKLVMLNQKGLIHSQQVGLWNDMISINQQLRVAHVFEKEGSNSIDNYIFKYDSLALTKIAGNTSDVTPCTSNPVMGEQASIMLMDNCELYYFDFKSEQLAKLHHSGALQAHKIRGASTIKLGEGQPQQFVFLEQQITDSKENNKITLKIMSGSSPWKVWEYPVDINQQNTLIGVGNQGKFLLASDKQIKIYGLAEKKKKEDIEEKEKDVEPNPPAPQPKPIPQPQPLPKPEPEPQPQPQPLPEPKPEPQPQPIDVDPQPQPHPQPQPIDVDPKPQPEPIEPTDQFKQFLFFPIFLLMLLFTIRFCVWACKWCFGSSQRQMNQIVLEQQKQLEPVPPNDEQKQQIKTQKKKHKQHNHDPVPQKFYNQHPRQQRAKRD